MNKLLLPVSLGTIVSTFWPSISVTWAVVLLENLLIAFVPLLIGMTIDGLLADQLDELVLLTLCLIILGAIAVGRRVYDSRAYGTIRLYLGIMLNDVSKSVAVSKRTARLDMSRELVDFLEEDVPDLITAIIQISVSLALLSYFSWGLGVSSVLVVAGMIGLYACFHKRFFQSNAALNALREQQVETLQNGTALRVFQHFRAVRGREVAISDTEAAVYGGIFMLQVVFIVVNLYLGAQLPDVTAGQIFAIATYSWEFVEAALLLPIALQSWSRLSEITGRINTLD